MKQATSRTTQVREGVGTRGLPLFSPANEARRMSPCTWCKRNKAKCRQVHRLDWIWICFISTSDSASRSSGVLLVRTVEDEGSERRAASRRGRIQILPPLSRPFACRPLIPVRIRRPWWPRNDATTRRAPVGDGPTVVVWRLALAAVRASKIRPNPNRNPQAIGSVGALECS